MHREVHMFLMAVAAVIFLLLWGCHSGAEHGPDGAPDSDTDGDTDTDTDTDSDMDTDTDTDGDTDTQTFEEKLVWARQILKNEGHARLVNLAATPEGVSLVTGWFSGTAVLGEGEPNETTLEYVSDGADCFIAQFGPGGDLAWARRAAGSGYTRPRDIAVLPDESCIVVGRFEGSVVFGEGEPDETTVSPAGETDMFLARYGPDGDLTWVTSAGGPVGDRGYSLAVLNDGVSFVAGGTAGGAVFGQGEPNETVLEDPVSFLASYAGDGFLDWVKALGAEGTPHPESIASNGEALFVVGSFEGTTTFGAGEANETTLVAEEDDELFFIARYELDGSFTWVRHATSMFGHAVGLGVAAMPDGSALATGYYIGETVFGPGEPNETSFFTGHSLFTAMFDPDGDLVWAKSPESAENQGNSVSGLDDGTSVVAGYLGTAWEPSETTETKGATTAHTFGAGEENETSLTSAGDADVVVAKYNPDGTLVWARRAGGGYVTTESCDDFGDDVAVLPDGSSLVTGSFRGEALFGPGEPNETVLVSEGADDVFLMRLLP